MGRMLYSPEEEVGVGIEEGIEVMGARVAIGLQCAGSGKEGWACG